MNLQRWRTLLSRLGLRQDDAARDALVAAYHEPHRHYHTADHINACLCFLDEAAGRMKNPEIVEIALWYHDAVFDPRAADNEERSAIWAESFLSAHGAAPDLSTQVYRLIMATRHAVADNAASDTAPSDAAPSDADRAWMIDIDLAVLGGDPVTYDRFENAIRQEYAWVDDAIFCEKRAALLRSFLDRPRLYATDYFFTRFEKSARLNLERALCALT